MDGERRETCASGRIPATRADEHALMAIAREQHGVLSLAQLCTGGIGESGVRHRVRRGRLRRVHRGVYAVGPLPLGAAGLDLAAVLACGYGALLGRRSAAARWGARPSSRRTVEVLTPRRAGRGRAGIEVHACTTLTAADRDRVDGIPITSLPRTLLDLAAFVDLRQLERAMLAICRRARLPEPRVNEWLALPAGWWLPT